MSKTAEQIMTIAENVNHLSERRNINKLYRAQDESNLYPINRRFNATERAIRRVRVEKESGCPLYGLEYCYAIEQELSNIVNQEV